MELRDSVGNSATFLYFFNLPPRIYTSQTYRDCFIMVTLDLIAIHYSVFITVFTY